MGRRKPRRLPNHGRLIRPFFHFTHLVLSIYFSSSFCPAIINGFRLLFNDIVRNGDPNEHPYNHVCSTTHWSRRYREARVSDRRCGPHPEGRSSFITGETIVIDGGGPHSCRNHIDTARQQGRVSCLPAQKSLQSTDRRHHSLKSSRLGNFFRCWLVEAAITDHRKQDVESASS